MGFESILFREKEVKLPESAPDFFEDLQLDYLIEQMTGQIKDYRVNRYFYLLPDTVELILYRQQVIRDMESAALFEWLQRFCVQLKESRRLYNLSLKAEGTMQSASYHLQAAVSYRETLLELFKGLSKCELVSEGMQELRQYVFQLMEELETNGFYENLVKASTLFSELSFRLSMNPDKLMVEERKEKIKKTDKNPVKNYFVELAKLLGADEQEHAFMRNVFPEALETSYLENELIELLRKSKPQVFCALQEFQKNYPVIYPEKILRLEEEIQFYLCYQKFKRRTEGLGYPMSVPAFSDSGEFQGQGVYDLALLWKQEEKKYSVVSNDFCMKEKPSFFVVTGPNQGGKTTFARSMGQAVYFALMGLCVNADSFVTPVFHGISTHFEAEEKLQSNSGKLKEEINRLAPMLMRVQNKRHFVILNELFTTATTHDAMIMGRKVMDAFLSRECYGIYVTHIQELAEETDEIISLVAQLAPGEEKRRTYRMLPMKAQGYGYSDALVEKFHLLYEDIVRRLS